MQEKIILRFVLHCQHAVFRPKHFKEQIFFQGDTILDRELGEGEKRENDINKVSTKLVNTSSTNDKMDLLRVYGSLKISAMEGQISGSASLDFTKETSESHR